MSNRASILRAANELIIPTGGLARVTLKGPSSQGNTWLEFDNWCERTKSQWHAPCEVSSPQGSWSVSSYDKDGFYHEDYWFENPQDAILFKLQNSNY